jgi:hypothetical protein
MLGLISRAGLTSTREPADERTGTAEVQSCSRDAADFWMTFSCDAKVRWDGERETVSERVQSVRDLSGTVPVERWGVWRGPSRVVSADYPFSYDSGLAYMLLFGIPCGGLVLGFYLGYRVGLLLPEPPPDKGPNKLVLRPMIRTRRPGIRRKRRS